MFTEELNSVSLNHLRLFYSNLCIDSDVYKSAFDISADLMELGRTPVAVVCAGVKSILDIGKTLEVLVTRQAWHENSSVTTLLTVIHRKLKVLPLQRSVRANAFPPFILVIVGLM